MENLHLIKLAEFCEKAEGFDENIDYQVACSTSHYGKFCDWETCKDDHKYTESLDCAIQLIEADEYWRLGKDGFGVSPAIFKATVTSHDKNAQIHFHDAYAATGALALTAAALKAMAHQA